MLRMELLCKLQEDEELFTAGKVTSPKAVLFVVTESPISVYESSFLAIISVVILFLGAVSRSFCLPASSCQSCYLMKYILDAIS